MTSYLQINITWLVDRLGFSVDQVNAENKIPLTSYYFWPKSDAWNQIDIELRSKIWIKQRERFIILNEITKIMNQWKSNVKIECTDIKFEFIGKP